MREVFFSQEAKNSSTMLARYGKCRRRDGVSILGDRSLYRCQVIPFCIKTRSFVSKPSNIDDSGNAVESSNGLAVFVFRQGTSTFVDESTWRRSALVKLNKELDWSASLPVTHQSSNFNH